MSHQLYQQMIIDHSKSPRGWVDEPKGCCEEAYNPLCGDQVSVCVKIEQGILQDIKFNGCGCSISIAAASILTQVAQGMSPDAFIVIMDEYSKMIKGEPHKDIPKKLLTFSGVSKYPMRVKCATMAWHALKAAIKKAQVPLILSDAVADYWQSLLDNMGQIGLHLQFKQLGCYGWQFVPVCTSDKPDDATEYICNGITVWINNTQIEDIKGTTVDYVQSPMGQSKVVFTHPSMVSQCGCGESFMVESS